MIRRVLFVDDDVAVRTAMHQTLELHGLEPLVAGSFVAAKDHIKPGFAGVIVSDIRMPGRDGFHLLEHAQGVDAELPVILLTGEGDIPMAVRAMGQGAFDFLEKPCAPADLIAVIERALKTRGLVLENRRLKAQLEAGDPAARMIFGTSALARELRAKVRNVAATKAEVLVTGPPGSGISKVAEVIHLMSEQAHGPFVKRPAAGVTVAEMEALCAEAAGGALFLDEVAAMPEAAQYALLERLERGAGARVIAGTTSDLAARAAQGMFSAELFYRLDVMRVRVPARAARGYPGSVSPLRRPGRRAGRADPAGNRPRQIGRADGAGLARKCARLDERGDAAGAGRARGRRSRGRTGPCRADRAGGAIAADRGAGARQRQGQPGGRGAEAAAQDFLRQAGALWYPARGLPALTKFAALPANVLKLRHISFDFTPVRLAA